MTNPTHVVDTRILPPDASLSTALGLHHTLATALADLVDNSIDAGASQVLIRFMRDGTQVPALMVIDDGAGMDSAAIDSAMTFGRRRDYGSADLGHFGVGLKAASLSQARALRVWSRAAKHSAQGRLIDSASPEGVHVVSVIDSEQAEKLFATVKPRFTLVTGTIVEWQGINTFLMSSDTDEQVGWIEETIDDVRSHLGIVFHRLIAKKAIQITVDVFQAQDGRPGPLRLVKAIDPCGYARSGDSRYPRPLALTLDGHNSVAIAHIWPARSNLPEFRLHGAPGREQQGLYFYRHDRLMQFGGWNGLSPRPADYGLARIVFDLDDALMQHVTINTEKSGVTLDATASAAIRNAAFVDGDGNFTSYRNDARLVMKAARSGQPRPVTIPEPADGLPEDVLDAFSDAVEFTVGTDPVRIGWRALARDAFFEVDLKTRTLWINARFRADLLGRRSLDPTDAPVLKTLIYLLVDEMFEGVRHSAKQQEKMQAWQAVLVAAMAAHRGQLKSQITESL